VMNTGRQLYHWHTGTMTRRASGLDQREPTPTVEIHPNDACELGLEDGDLVRLNLAPQHDGELVFAFPSA